MIRTKELYRDLSIYMYKDCKYIARSQVKSPTLKAVIGYYQYWVKLPNGRYYCPIYKWEADEHKRAIRRKFISWMNSTTNDKDKNKLIKKWHCVVKHTLYNHRLFY